MQSKVSQTTRFSRPLLWQMQTWTGLIWLRIGNIWGGGGSCRHSTEPSGCIKCRGNSWLVFNLLDSQEGLCFRGEIQLAFKLLFKASLNYQTALHSLVRVHSSATNSKGLRKGVLPKSPACFNLKLPRCQIWGCCFVDSPFNILHWSLRQSFNCFFPSNKS